MIRSVSAFRRAGWAVAGLLVCVAPLWAEDNTLSESEQRSGWKLLFDGKSTQGWRNYKQEGISKGWTAKDGALTRSADGAGDIVTAEQYDSFELSLEYNISKGGNSGLMFHVTEEYDAPWQTGPEVQVQDNVDGHDPQKAGWLYQLYAPKTDFFTKKVPDATRPVGQWNHIQLRVTPAGGEINVNGYRYATFQKGSDDWNAKVAASKFKAFPNFGKPTKGYICLQDHGNLVSYRNVKIRTLGPKGEAPEPIDGTLPLAAELAFPNIQWADWSPEDADGRLQAFRPIVVTHANDDTNTLYVANQWGEVYSLDNKADVTDSKVFINLRDRVSYKDNENEEGFLGMAFHPEYKKNGQFFVYYTMKGEDHTSVVSRFTAKNGVGDPASEEVLLKIPQPFWNHNGGTIAFGKDGYLYISLGDGGAGNDPFSNGQNLETLLGKILRIDVNKKSEGLPYAIPTDNPLIFHSGEKIRREIFAYGFRNPWGINFDRETGDLWCADVGQNLWEEIDIVTKGGNYGWAIREGQHAFGPQGSEARPELIEPVWEYDHQVGSSITGGIVYRGKKFPNLVGKYVYADYVSGKIWALHYDQKAKKVVSNEAIPSPKMPIIHFGEDADGEIYFCVVSANGQGIYRFVNK